jgi:hypothetical protein
MILVNGEEERRPLVGEEEGKVVKKRNDPSRNGGLNCFGKMA